MMLPMFSLFPGVSARRAAAFSLIEVTLALGIVTFALVGAVGVLPTALASGRQSATKNRAAAIADTLFTGFRTQPFQAVCYLDSQFDANGNVLPSPSPAPLDLNSVIPASGVKFYASVLDGYTPVSAVTSSDPLGTQRHLRFASGTTDSSDYMVTMYFNNQPSGTVVAPQANSIPNKQPVIPAQANQIEMIISPVYRPTEQYHFVSTIANRSN